MCAEIFLARNNRGESVIETCGHEFYRQVESNTLVCEFHTFIGNTAACLIIVELNRKGTIDCDEITCDFMYDNCPILIIDLLMILFRENFNFINA